MANGRWNICSCLTLASSIARYIARYILCGVPVSTLTAISVGRLLALLLGLRYRQVVTLKRTYVIVITIWFIFTVLSAIWFWKPLIDLWCINIVISLCLLTSIFSYTKIFLTLRHHQNEVQDHVQQSNQTNQLNTARYKKAVFTAIWLQLTLIACYLPCAVAEAFRANIGLSASLYNVRICTTTLVYLNSSLNPILYCWKLNEIRQAAKNTIRQLFCHIF